jgi:hypothetical protein
MKPWTIAGSVLLAALAVNFGRPWVALGAHARAYPVTGTSDAANVVIDGAHVFASRANRGFEVLDTSSGSVVASVAPPRGSESIDDLSIAGHFLFALDARPPGHLSVFSIEDPSKPILVSDPVDVAVGPFSGVSAAAGQVIVSGGTSRMSLRTYDAHGKLSASSRPQISDAVNPTSCSHRTASARCLDALWSVFRSDDGARRQFARGSRERSSRHVWLHRWRREARELPLETALDGNTADRGCSRTHDRRGRSLRAASGREARRRRESRERRRPRSRRRDRRLLPKPRLVLVDISPRNPRIVRSIDLPKESSHRCCHRRGAHRRRLHEQVLIIPKEKS